MVSNIFLHYIFNFIIVLNFFNEILLFYLKKILFSEEMWDMLSDNIRGGLSFASQRYAESAVYEDMIGKKRTLDDFGRFNIILDIDANNLYGTCQTFPLPFKDFTFLSNEDIKKINWNTIDLTRDKGYFIEVTLIYPENIREKTKSFPLCPENKKITYDMLSPYQKSVLDSIYGKKTYSEKKLTSTFLKREKIVLHGLNLQLYLKLGLEIEQVFRVISFTQKPFMKDWVDFCTEKRSQSKDDFTKNFWKLLVNSVYGKTIESVSNRKNVKIAKDASTFSLLVTRPNYERHIIINPNLVIVILSPEYVKMNKPYYIGFSILEISKYIMYDFFYNILVPYFGDEGVSLLYSDTDSLAINVKTCDILSDLKNLSSNMDFSNLDISHPLFSNENKALLFKFKEEFSLNPISRLCALKSKVYSFETACVHKIGMNQQGKCLNCLNKTFTGKNFNKLKGIQKKTAREIHFDKYLKCVKSSYSQRNTVYQIISKKQKLTTNKVSKISLSSFCDKRFILNCGIHSEPYSENNSPFCTKCLF